MRRRLFAWRTAISLAMVTLLLAGCGAAATTQPNNKNAMPSTPTERTFNTPLGELKLAEPPKRIVALNLQAIDSLVVLGVQPVGIALPGGELPAYLPEVKDIPNVGSHSSPSVEKVASLKPDLIILDPELQKDQIEPMSKVAKVLGIRGRHWQNTLDELTLLGDILGKQTEAERFGNEFRTKLVDYKTKAPGQVTVLGLYGAPDKFMVWTAKSFIGSLLEELKADYLYKGSATDDYTDNASTSMEKVLAMNPDALFLFSGKDKLSDAWKANPIYGKLKAAQNNKVFEMERNLWSRSRGPIAAGKILEQAASALYPNTFPLR